MRSTDEVYGSPAYDSALLLRVPLCVSRAFLVKLKIGTVITHALKNDHADFNFSIIGFCIYSLYRMYRRRRTDRQTDWQDT